MGDAVHLLSMTDDRIRLWTPRELSDFTGIPVRTLADWRTARSRRRGLGLPFVALSPRNVRYREEDIVAFIAGKLVAPTDGKDD